MLRAVLERASLKALEYEETSKKGGKSSIELLPCDLLIKIFLLVQPESLRRSCFVCKEWFNIINCFAFIEEHAHKSEAVLIFLGQNLRYVRRNLDIEMIQDNMRSVIATSKQDFRHHIHFVELFNGKFSVTKSSVTSMSFILSTCNGLILGSSRKQKALIVVNPATRKFISLPLGTILYDESYALVYVRNTKEYKVVHLFRDEEGYIGCEILNLAKRSWFAVDGPSSEIFKNFSSNPVSLSGFLYWLPGIYDSNYLVSLNMIDEKFSTIPLPFNSTSNDKLVVIRGSLSCLTLVAFLRMDVWTLKRDSKNESWIKQHSIDLRHCELMSFQPIFASSSGGELVIEGEGDEDSTVYVYDFKSKVLKKVETGWTFSPHLYCCGPHLQTLASWEH